MHVGPCLVVERAAKHFGGLVAVKEIDLTVEYGERRGIIGPNGAGKTTLFNIIAGDLPPTHGEVFLHGQNITHLPNHRRAYLGMSRTFQITNLFPAMTVMDNVLLAAQALQRSKFSMFRPISSYREICKRTEGFLERFDLLEMRNNYVRNLSHGIQRQIEVALALVEDPRIILLDEPTAGLSPAESANMTTMLKSLDSEVTMLIIEHDMDVIFDLVDKVMVMHEGEVLADGPVAEIRSNQAVQEIYLGYE